MNGALRLCAIARATYNGNDTKDNKGCLSVLLLLAIDAGKDVFEMGLCVGGLFLEVLFFARQVGMVESVGVPCHSRGQKKEV